VRDGHLRATALVTESLERLERATDLNVVSEIAVDEALREAKRIDEGERAPGPLLGAPLLIKDLEDWRGHPTKKGSLALRDAPAATENATVPARLMGAGAVAVGKSTLPEFAIEGYTANLLTGVTRNPWNLEYSPGGSSGGSASALAAGLVLIGTATDGGGSVRIPASLCGLVGLKPTNGVVGRWPTPDWIDYSTDGPLATSCDDLALLFDVMRGPTPGDPNAPTVAMLDAIAHRRDQPITLFAAERTSPLGALPKDVATLFADAVAAVADVFKVRVEWRSAEGFFPDGDPDLDWFSVCAAEHVNALGRQWVTSNMDTFHVATQEFLEAGLRVNVDEYLEARRRRYHYARTMDMMLGDNGVLLTPSVASSGWLADGRMSEGAEVHGLAPAVYSTAMQNITGQPAISVPMGHFSNAVRFGLQLTGRHYDDLRLINLARVIQRAYPWPRTAPGYPGLETLLD
jgi:Asp-tRNA(Asn)/Glu-tRNA(Gln) amidotransferase A subunit family amidase